MSPHATDFDALTEGYFERNNSGLVGEVSFLVLPDKAAFDAVFGFGATMGPMPKRLPREAFDSSLVVAVIHRGNAIWSYQVDEVAPHEGGLRVSYRAHKGSASSAQYATPLILRLPKQGIAQVQLVENGKPVATLRPGPSSPEPRAG